MTPMVMIFYLNSQYTSTLGLTWNKIITVMEHFEEELVRSTIDYTNFEQ